LQFRKDSVHYGIPLRNGHHQGDTEDEEFHNDRPHNCLHRKPADVCRFADTFTNGLVVRLSAAPVLRRDINRCLGELGFSYVTLDLGGYKTGSMNKGLAEVDKKEKMM